MKELELQSCRTTYGSRNPSIAIVNIKWDARPRNRGSIPHRDRRFVSCPKHADRLWDPSSVLLGTAVSIPGGKWAGRETDRCHLASWLEYVELYPTPIYAFLACTGRTLSPLCVMLCNSHGAELATFFECAKNNTKTKESSNTRFRLHPH